MKPITRQDLMGYEDYERRRDTYRQQIIELKRRRRIAVGELIMLVFENRETLRFQIQEMIRVERIVHPDKVQEELDVYNALLPGDDELSATLMIEITDNDRLQADLDRMQGIDGDRMIALHAGSETIFGVAEGGHSREDKLSAVHFVKFPVTGAWRQALSESHPAAIETHHPRYRHRTVVPPELRREWLADLGVQ